MMIWLWLAGDSGQLLSSACVTIVLILMMLMAIRLYISYRKHPVHRLLLWILPLMILHQGLLACESIFPVDSLPLLGLAVRLLGTSSFIIINVVFMKLYSRPSIKLRRMPFIIVFLLTFIIAGVNLMLSPEALDPGLASGSVKLIGVDVYSILISILILLDTRGVEMSIKFSGSLILYFTYELIRVLDRYLFHGEAPLLLAINHLIPIVYITLLFLLLFEWVVDRLLLTYQSSITDGLTGLYNRKHFQIKAEQLLRHRKQIAVVFCDIDNFKRLNDTEGHHRADLVLKQVADILREECAGIGAAGRYGGEELLIVVGGKDKPQDVAEAVRSRVQKETPVTVSIGVSFSTDGMRVEEIVKQADEAMYTSKTTGKNKITVTPAPPRAKAASY